MLAELAACNAAFSTIKTFIKNGRSIADCAVQIGTIVANKEALQKKVEKKRSGFMAQLRDTTAQDLEEFLALEKIKEHEKTLKELMIYQGRGGMWADWVKFQADARKKRKAEQLQREKQIQELIEATAIISMVIVGVIAAIAAVILWT
jgi:hypothetical protein